MIDASRAARVGLLGYPVEHSLSPAMHNAAFRAAGLPWHYSLCPAAPEEFDAIVSQCVREGYAGWNVTVPHKERMVAYLDEASTEVKATGACNTVRVEGSWLVGHNTDVAGFLAGVAEAGGIEPGSRAVLLGAGGAARAVAWALGYKGHQVMALARDEGRAASLAESMDGSDMAYGKLDANTLNEALREVTLLVNCTPVGMWPCGDCSPVPVGVHLPAHLLVYDLIYRPRPTRLLREAAAVGCRTQDGLAMLVRQGAASFEIWTGRRAPVGVMTRACLDALGAADDRKQGK